MMYGPPLRFFASSPNSHKNKETKSLDHVKDKLGTRHFHENEFLPRPKWVYSCKHELENDKKRQKIDSFSQGTNIALQSRIILGSVLLLQIKLLLLAKIRRVQIIHICIIKVCFVLVLWISRLQIWPIDLWWALVLILLSFLLILSFFELLDGFDFELPHIQRLLRGILQSEHWQNQKDKYVRSEAIEKHQSPF